MTNILIDLAYLVVYVLAAVAGIAILIWGADQLL